MVAAQDIIIIIMYLFVFPLFFFALIPCKVGDRVVDVTQLTFSCFSFKPFPSSKLCSSYIFVTGISADYCLMVGSLFPPYILILVWFD